MNYNDNEKSYRSGLLQQQSWQRQGEVDYKKKLDSNKVVVGDEHIYKHGIDPYLQQVSDLIENERNSYKNKSPRTIPFGLHQTLLLNTNVIAHIILNECHEACLSERVDSVQTRTKVIHRLGESLSSEIRAERLATEAATKAKLLENRQKKTNMPRWQFNKQVDKQLQKIGVVIPAFTKKDVVKLGAWAINFALNINLGLFTDEGWVYKTDQTRAKGVKAQKRFQFSKEFSLKLGVHRHVAAWTNPKFGLSIIQVENWNRLSNSKDKEGIFIHQPLNSQFPYVKNCSPTQRKAIDDALKTGQLDYCQTAINNLNAVPLAVNGYVLDAILYCRIEGKQVGKLFLENELPEITATAEEWDAMEAHEIRAFIQKRDSRRNENLTIIATNELIQRKIDDLWQFVDGTKENKCYGYHNHDNRGRVNAGSIVNYQDADHFRACFNFYNALPITKQGITALKIHLANKFDERYDSGIRVSKMPHSARTAWTELNHKIIMEVGTDIKSSFDLWTKASDPFQFLAAAKEYADWHNDGCSEDFLTVLPISKDMTCSGIQLFSCASLSEEDGPKVNLVPNKAPADIYQNVSDLVVEKLKTVISKRSESEDNEQNAQVAEQWLKFGVSRSVVKRPTMTWGYSGTLAGFRKQIYDDTVKPQNDKDPSTFASLDWSNKKAGRDAASLLATICLSSIIAVVKDADKGMDFMRGIALALYKEDKQLNYTTPIGFPLQQSYAQWRVEKVKTRIYNRKVNLKEDNHVYWQTDQNNMPLLKDKCLNGAAPNLIHSLDATLLMKPVNTCNDNGISDLLVVHDSFATHACNVTTMAQVCRAQLRDMFIGYDFYQDLLDQNIGRIKSEEIKSEIPKVPARGKLDLNNLEQCDYMLD